MRILIVGGAGLMSAGTARDLLSKLSSGTTNIIAADSNAERLESLKNLCLTHDWKPMSLM